MEAPSEFRLNSSVDWQCYSSAGAGHTALRPAQLTTQHSTVAPIAINLAMRHGTETAQHLKHTTIDFNRKTRKLTCVFTHLVEILNPGKPPQQ